MPKLTIEIDCDNAAFEFAHQELSKCLARVAGSAAPPVEANKKDSGVILDTFGNNVGQWTVKP